MHGRSRSRRWEGEEEGGGEEGRQRSLASGERVCEGGMDDEEATNGEENRPANGPHADPRPANGSSDVSCRSPHSAEEEDPPEIDIHVTNVVSDFGTRCHLNLRQIATKGSNVIYKREQGVSRPATLTEGLP